MKKTNQKGSVSLFVLVSCLFFIIFLISMFMLSAVERQAQIEATKQTENIYAQGNANEIYSNYFNESIVVPIYTKAQLDKMCSGEQIAINEEGGKIYTFSENSIYLLKEDITFENEGIWEIPTFGETGRIEGNGKNITIKDTSKTEETYYYYMDDNEYKFPLTKEGYAYSRLNLHYDGINNTGSGHGNLTQWKDLSGNGNNGTLTDTFSDSDWQQNGLKFGDNKYVETVKQDGLYGNSMTVEVDFRRKGEVTDQYYSALISRSNGSGYFDNYLLYIVNDYNMGARVGFGNSNDITFSTSASNVKDKIYTYTKVFYYDNTNNKTTVKLYINGGLIATGIMDGACYVDSSFVTKLGTFEGSAQFFDGIIHSARIYDRAITEEEIVQNYKISEKRFGSGDTNSGETETTEKGIATSGTDYTIVPNGEAKELGEYTGSIEIQAGVETREVELYYVATIEDENYNYVSELAESEASRIQNLSECTIENTETVAKLLNNLLINEMWYNNISPIWLGSTDANGSAVITDLERGVYLLRFSAVQIGDTIYKEKNILFEIPLKDEDGLYYYDILLNLYQTAVAISEEYQECTVEVDPSRIENQEEILAGYTLEIYRDRELYETIVLDESNEYIYEWGVDGNIYEWNCIIINLYENQLISFDSVIEGNTTKFVVIEETTE